MGFVLGRELVAMGVGTLMAERGLFVAVLMVLVVVSGRHCHE